MALAGDRSLRLPRPLPAAEVERIAILHSLPDWLARRFARQHGVRGLRAIGEAASREPDIFLRVGDGSERATLRAELAALGVEVEDAEHQRLLRWCGGGSPFDTAAFHEGRFVVQDPTSLAAVEAVPCGPGDRVVDLCAAPGTKTTWLAERVQPDGRVFAHDVDAKRRPLIVANAERLGLAGVVEVVSEPGELPNADCVLADVPCSNTGVLGRRVEVRRRLTEATFTELPRVQHELLERAIRLTRPGGYTVYSTCSIDADENEAVVAAALEAHPGLEQIEARLTLPRVREHDGGYFAVLRRGRG
ncbi:MAG TPA: RsmB/NOP family class I SAM-dependent RNA methyltransferase [bacterium]|nr:RsmB/NOP family class I SAM-dependent RNA methyltransferase [bacterium]